jgi:hypothetical protein
MRSVATTNAAAVTSKVAVSQFTCASMLIVPRTASPRSAHSACLGMLTAEQVWARGGENENPAG